MTFEAKFTFEEAWAGGPLRKIGSGYGSPSKYVCGVCKRSCMGVFLAKPRESEREMANPWVCAGCLEKVA